MSSLCKHGKRPATPGDLRAYEKRPDCWARGDCKCLRCKRVCWVGECCGDNFERVVESADEENESDA